MHEKPFPWGRRLPGLLSLLSLLSLLLVFLAGCEPLPFLQTPAEPVAFPTTTPTAEITPTVTPYTGECAFVWSNKSLPEVSEQVNESLGDAGFPEVEAEAVAYGENCLDPNTNAVVRFTAMQTDIYARVSVPDASDGQAMGDWIERIAGVLNELPAETLPGPNRGYLGITFDSALGSTSLWFPRSKADGLLNDGVRGSDLFEALRGP